LIYPSNINLGNAIVLMLVYQARPILLLAGSLGVGHAQVKVYAPPQTSCALTEWCSPIGYLDICGRQLTRCYHRKATCH